MINEYTNEERFSTGIPYVKGNPPGSIPTRTSTKDRAVEPYRIVVEPNIRRRTSKKGRGERAVEPYRIEVKPKNIKESNDQNMIIREVAGYIDKRMKYSNNLATYEYLLTGSGVDTNIFSGIYSRNVYDIIINELVPILIKLLTFTDVPTIMDNFYYIYNAIEKIYDGIVYWYNDNIEERFSRIINHAMELIDHEIENNPEQNFWENVYSILSDIAFIQKPCGNIIRDVAITPTFDEIDERETSEGSQYSQDSQDSLSTGLGSEGTVSVSDYLTRPIPLRNNRRNRMAFIPNSPDSQEETMPDTQDTDISLLSSSGNEEENQDLHKTYLSFKQHGIDWTWVYLTTISINQFNRIFEGYSLGQTVGSYKIIRDDLIRDYSRLLPDVLLIPDVSLNELYEYAIQHQEDMWIFTQSTFQHIQPLPPIPTVLNDRPLRINDSEIDGYRLTPQQMSIQSNNRIPFYQSDVLYNTYDTTITSQRGGTISKSISQVGGKSLSVKRLENLIMSIHTIITSPTSPETMVVNTLIKSPMYLKDGIFFGNKLVLDWLGLVMAYLIFLNGNGDDADFDATITYDSDVQNRLTTSNLLMSDFCNNNVGFCVVPFATMTPLINSCFTLNHTEGMNIHSRTHYVMLRTSPRYNPTNGTKILSIYNGSLGNASTAAYNISYDNFVRLIDTIRDTELKLIPAINTFCQLRNQAVSIIANGVSSLLKQDGVNVNYQALLPDSKLTLYNPDILRINTPLHEIYSNISSSSELSENPPPLTCGDYNTLSEYFMRQPVLKSATNSKPPTDNWSSSYKRAVNVQYSIFTQPQPPGAPVDPIRNMGNQVRIFNSDHLAIINALWAPERCNVRYKDDTISFGFQDTNTSPILGVLQTFLNNNAINVKFSDRFVSHTINNSTNQVQYKKICSMGSNFPSNNKNSLDNYLYLALPADMIHDATDSRTSKLIARFIQSIADKAFAQNGAFRYADLVKKTKKTVPGIGKLSYERASAYTIFMNETKYAFAVNNSQNNNDGISKQNVGITKDNANRYFTQRDGVYNFNNAVWGGSENAGNSGTFVDGGTKKSLEYINLPNICICINDQDTKFFVIVSYDIKVNTLDTSKPPNLVMNVSLYYIKQSGAQYKHVFVNHTFILGTGISCSDIYADIFRSHNTPANRPPEGSDPILAVFLYLKKTLCDWLQNFLKIQIHTKPNLRLGFFVKVRDPETLNQLRTNTYTLATSPFEYSDYNSFISIDFSTVLTSPQPNHSLFNYINIYWEHFTPAYSPNHYRYFNTLCPLDRRIGTTPPNFSTWCVTGDILDFCTSAKLPELQLIEVLVPRLGIQPYNTIQDVCDGVVESTIDLTPYTTDKFSGGFNHNNHKRKRKISYSNTKKKFGKSKTTKKNMKGKVSKKKPKQNKMKSKLTKKYRNKY
jgi:hypothetical protein